MLSGFISAAAVVLADWTVLPAVIFRVLRKNAIDTYWQQAPLKHKLPSRYFPQRRMCLRFTGIETLFPFIQHPTPLQQKALELDINVDGAQLFILEDITGAGKTKAALMWLID